MTLGWRLFMWAAALPVLPIMYFVQKNECKPKKNIIVGVTRAPAGRRTTAPSLRPVVIYPSAFNSW